MTAAPSRRQATSRRRKAPAELGEVRFEDWYDTPIFESDPDERLEELTTSGARPLRAAARALVRLDAAKVARRRRREPAAPPAGDHPVAGDHPAAGDPSAEDEGRSAVFPADGTDSSPVPAAEADTAPVPAVAPAPTGRTGSRAPGRSPAVRSGSGRTGAGTPQGRPRQTGTAAGRPEPTRRRTNRSATAGTSPAPTPPAPTAPAPTAPVSTAPSERGATGTTATAGDAGAAGWRRRAGRALDAWAEREVATQARMERVLLPKRWQA